MDREVWGNVELVNSFFLTKYLPQMTNEDLEVFSKNCDKNGEISKDNLVRLTKQSSFWKEGATEYLKIPTPPVSKPDGVAPSITDPLRVSVLNQPLCKIQPFPEPPLYIARNILCNHAIEKKIRADTAQTHGPPRSVYISFLLHNVCRPCRSSPSAGLGHVCSCLWPD